MNPRAYFLVYFTSSWLLLTTAKHYDHNDPIYVQKTGKTYDELVKSGDYIPVEVFENFTDSVWKDHSKVNTPESRSHASPDEVKYWFYDDDLKSGIKIRKNVASIKQAGWKPELGLKVIIHGFKNNAESKIITHIKNAYLWSESPNNIMAVDWSEYAGWTLNPLTTFGYENAAVKTEEIGDFVGDFIAYLVDKKLVKNAGSVHIIGHSLGAHVAGRAGRRLRVDHDKQILGRVTGLDPAGPSFYESITSKRLDPTDAKFVDVIHTDMGDINPFSTIDFGTEIPSGHVDFYPNGGRHQPGCDDMFLIGGLIGTCEHRMAWEFFVKSIRTKNKYKACSCISWTKYKKGACTNNKDECKKATAIMGEHCQPGTKGAFYLRTNSQMNQI